MIEEKIHYLYRHIRLDKNEPFYIGVGTVLKKDLHRSNIRSFYKRAFSELDRNIFWHRIVNKTSYKVEILLESNNLDYIFSKEIEFILLYGRRDYKTGSLCNLTEGGKGSSKTILRKSLRELYALNTLKILPRKRGPKYPYSKACYIYNLEGVFTQKIISLMEASRILGVSRNPGRICREDNIWYSNGYLISKEYLGTNVMPYKPYDYMGRKRRNTIKEISQI